MKFGVFYELQLPRPWNDQSEYQLYHGALDQLELDPFGVAFEDKRARWEDGIRCIILMFADGGSEYHGTHYDFPARTVLPKPRQRPHPPLWMACSQLDTIAYAGERGFGALGFQFVSADAAHAWVHAYYNGITRRLEPLADYQINPNVALVSMFMCADTDEGARARADGATFFQFCLRYYAASRGRPRRSGASCPSSRSPTSTR